MGANEEIGATAGVYRIRLNGSSPERWVERAVQRIVVEDEINVPAMVSIEMALMVYTQKNSSRSEDLLFLDDELFDIFAPGVEIEVFMGMDSPEKIFSGVSAAMSPRFGDKSILEITGFDPLYKLMFGKKIRSFSEMTDSDIISEVARDTDLQVNAEATNSTYPYVFQNNSSDYDFLLERAQRIGYEIYVEDGSLVFRMPADGEDASVSLQFGRDLHYFYPSMKTITEGSEVEFRGWDFRNKATLTGRAEDGDENVRPRSGGGSSQRSAFEVSSGLSTSPTTVVGESVLDDGEADILAKARYNELIQKFISGEGRCQGNPGIRAGKTVEISGLGPKFNGIYYVTSSRHIWEEGSYITNFNVRRTIV